MIELHPEILKKNGREEFSVLPYEEFLALTEVLADYEDLQELRAAKLEEGNAETDEDIREFMSGNICRCAAYPNIIAAIREVQEA